MRHSAFTLTELLVVIVIILSITAMILPAVHNARNSAKAAACSANSARILSAMAAYESMNESFPYGLDSPRSDPPPGGFVGSASYDPPTGWWWFHFIDVYSGGSPYKPAVVKCSAKRLPVRWMNFDILCGNYGVNLSICRQSSKTQKTEFKGMSTLSRSDVKSPDRTMLLVDSGYAIIKWHHATQNPPVALSSNIVDKAAYIPGLSINSQRLSQGRIFTGMEKDAIDGRHPGKTVNVGFVDGHVERRKAEDLLVDSEGEPAGDSDIKWKAK